jgi:cation:H+ antiporter
MTLTYILFLIGFVLLIYGARFLVDGASVLANRLGVSALVIGLTIVAFGTSAPELIVNILASARGATDMAIGNILGSNIANILLVLGIAAVIYPIKVSKGTVWKEIPLALLAVFMVGVMANDTRLDGAVFSGLTRSDGLVFMAFLIIFVYYVVGISKSETSQKLNIAHKHPTYISILMVLGGLVGLTLGGKWVVDGAVAIATNFGISEAVIGLSIVAFGTSLPELATSIVAAFKRFPDIAVGNIVGSNIFNIFWVLGASALIRPLPFSPEMMRDVGMDIFATFLLFIFMFVGRRHVLQRSQGAGFVALYIFYIAYIFMRG